MRVASWLFLLCTLLGAAGVFVSSIEVDAKLGRHGTLSLYRAQAERQVAGRVLAAYNKSHGKKVGAPLIALVMPKVTGRAHDALDDAQSAMSELDGLTQDDVRTLGIVLVATVWTFLALHLVAGVIVLRQTVNGRFRRGQLVVAGVLSLVGVAIAVACQMVCGEVVFEANDELGASALAVGSGTGIMVGAGIASLVALAVMIVLDVRARRKVIA